jgi:hypothetical protein
MKRNLKGLLIVGGLAILLCLCLGSSGFCEEIIFRPGPGLNNGTDDGSAGSGKDATGGTCNDPGANYGANPTMFAMPVSNGCNSCNSKNFIQFNLNSLPSNVTHVYLGFTHLPLDTCYSNCTADFYFYPILQSWDEMTVSLSNEPTHGAPVYGPITISTPNNLGNQEYEITSLYQQWKSGATPNYGIEIAATTVGCNNAATMFYVYSSDAEDSSVRPYLRIITEPQAVPTLNEIGMMLTALLLGIASFVYMNRRKAVIS